MLTTCTLLYSRSLELFIPCQSEALVVFSCSVVSDSSWPHGLQLPRLPCPSLSPGVCSNSCPLSRWYHSTISSYFLLLLLPLTFPSIGGFSNKLALGTRRPNHRSFSVSISPSNKHSGLISFRIDWLDLLAPPGALKSLSPKLQFKNINFSVLSLLYSPILTAIHDYWKKP